MKKKYIGVPMKAGCNVKGADEGIKVINENFSLDKIIDIEEKENDIETVFNGCESLAKEVDETIKSGMIPVSVGGDHSLAIGSIAGSSNNYDNLGLVWIDAHSDINTCETTTTYNIHGYPVAISMGEGLNNLVNCYHKNKKIKCENIVLFGCNDIDLPEEKIIEDFNIKLIKYDEIIKNGFENALTDAKNYLNNKVKNIHLSIDIDSLNPNSFMGVNVPSYYDKGFKLDELKSTIKYFLNNFNVVSIDLVEYNPLTDKNDVTKNAFLDILKIIEEYKK